LVKNIKKEEVKSDEPNSGKCTSVGVHKSCDRICASYPTRETVPLMEFINKFLNSISAMLPLPSATLPLHLFKILPLPLPFTSRAALDRPAKINKPIVKETQASVRSPNFSV